MLRGPGSGEHPLQDPQQGRPGPAETADLLLQVQQETGGDPGSGLSFQSGLGGAGENFHVREKCAVFSGSAGGRPAAAGAPQLGAAAGAGHGAGLRGLRHGGDAAAQSAPRDPDAQPGRAAGPGGPRRGRGGDQRVSGGVQRTEDQRQGVRVSEGSDPVHSG